MRHSICALSLATLALPTASALARPPSWAPAHGYRAKSGAIAYRTTDNGIRYWQGSDGRYYCKRGNGTTGLLIGAALGALVGRAIDTRGERVTGTVLGGVAGAVIGREIDRGPTRCR
ncbi:hypothetical protein C0V78_05655 [Novosphingobium sp. TH158]|nr:glycine zipper 2TM domain-containing protein [Novosphingobium sp. TH158]PLK27821.1 hypothetical protein C0V78_05655 [Novosphingobium sp. TH158]